MNNPAHTAAARDIARKSIVLLKNDQQLLPLSKQTGSIALIGPFIRAVRDNLGFWSMEWPDDSINIISQWEGIQKRVSAGTRLIYAKGCNINDSSRAGFSEAVEAALGADVVVLSVGEARDMSGEAKSRSSIQLPGVQEELIKAIHATGKPVIVLVNAGRPLVFNWTADNVPAILYTWWLGTEAGNAIADVLFGEYNPSAKLPVTFPRSEGQIPIYYNHYNTGRPAKNEYDLNYVSAYIDLPNSPRYPFGYGLSYTQFSYSDLVIGSKTIRKDRPLTISVKIKNTGRYDGRETVQLYVRDKVASVVRPVKELKGFQQVALKAGETKIISFDLTIEDLKFYNQTLRFIAEPGEFELMVGGNSRDVLSASFSWEGN